MARGDKEPLPVYQCLPPEWLPKAHSSADLGAQTLLPVLEPLGQLIVGYVGFYPPRPDQEEEILSETNVKNGLSHGQVVEVRFLVSYPRLVGL